MPLWPIISTLATASRYIGPRSKRQGTAAFMLLPLLIISAFVLLYVTGVFQPGLGSLFSLPLRELGIAVLGLMLAMGAGKDKRWLGMVAGIIITVVALYNAATMVIFLKDNSLQAILRDKLPVIEECLPNPSGFWEEHKPQFTLPDFPDINLPGR